MIDERAVLTAKFWEALRSLRAPSRLREGEFEQFALMALGLACVVQLHLRRPNDRVRKTFDTLLNADEALRDQNHFRHAWANAYDALVEVLGISDRTDSPPEVGSFNEFRGIVSLLDVQNTWSSKQHFLLSCFDEVFHRVVGRITAIGYRSGDSAAALAAHLSASFYDSSEYFTTTGEFAVLRRSILNESTTARVGVLDRLNFFVCLRLYLHDIRVVDQPLDEEKLTSFVARRFLLIDHPRRKTSGRRSNSVGWADQQTSLEALDHLHYRSSLGACLILVPGADRSASGWRKQLREYLVSSGQVIAVIDLPLDRSDGSRKQVSAWLLSERHSTYREVLMVDSKSLAGKGELREIDSLMAFVAAIVSLGTSGAWPPRGLARNDRPNSGDVEAMLNAYFKDGYRNLEGVCRIVNTSEIEANEWKLAASIYLERTEKRKAFVPLLNSEPVLEALLQRHDQSSRIYVIGNNGEGKSILLGDLAELLVQHGRRVVGISFGLTDRFPFKRPKNEGQRFLYVGARTSERGISLGRTSADVDRMVHEIHVDAQRLGVFNAVVKHLGFGERRYLVPVGLKNSFDDDRSRYAELQQLTDNVDDNARILQHTTPKGYVLGLMRQESQSAITTFGELSSGEQQLLTLALKLTTYADNTTVMLVDEPELSLHVSWQRAIPAMLEIIGSRLGCSIVVATHSPVIVASATHRNDLCFVARRHALTELSPRQRKSVETALFDGFRTYTANNRQVHERCAAMVSLAIQRLNSPSPEQNPELPTVESLYEEVELMDQIIRMAGSARLSYTREDLELVARTRAALDELVAIQRESTT